MKRGFLNTIALAKTENEKEIIRSLWREKFPEAPVDDKTYGRKNGDWSEITAGGKGIPCGGIVSWPSTAVPGGWLLCDGSAVSRALYADLFATIGTNWGEGDGATTFNLPNLTKSDYPISVDISYDEEGNAIVDSVDTEKKYHIINYRATTDQINTILHGTVAPTAGFGLDGDFYIRTDTLEIYGPKMAGSWGEATSMVGGGSGGGIINILYADLVVEIENSTLVTGKFYKIIDRGNLGLLFQAIDVNKLAIDGVRFMLCPAYYTIGADAYGNNWIGVWNLTKTATLNDLTIWNGIVWKCIVEVTEPLDSPDQNVVNWELISKSAFANHEYLEMIFGCSYDVANDWICKQWDNRGNVFGCDYNTGQNNDGINYCDLSDWNDISIIDNQCFGIFNNSISGEIRDNRNIGTIDNNRGGSINGNSNNGYISNNSVLGEIANNYNKGVIVSNSNEGSILFNLNTDQISSNSNIGDIVHNFNTGQISSNSNIGNISDNFNTGNIFDNSNTGNISDNSNKGDIINNSNKGGIYCNFNTGTISFNLNLGDIYFNSNIGDISANSSVVREIGYNSNKGEIISNSNTSNITYN